MKFAFATAFLKIETLGMCRRFARVPFAAGCIFDVIGSVFGQRQLVMVNCACGFNKSENNQSFGFCGYHPP